ncbi:MAG: PAS domain S-box protein [Anaerolineae bacterium]|nr:PAS domain S-box protein [Anaerolineae bacterium]
MTVDGDNAPKPPPSHDSVIDLIRRLAEAEAALREAVSGADAVIDPDRGAPLLLSAAQDALQRSEARYNRLMARMAAVVFELTPDGVIEYVNDAASEVTGYRSDELLGRRVQEILFPGDLARQIDALTVRFASGDVTGHELTLAAKDGQRVVLEFNSANQYCADGTLDKIVGLGINITRRKEAERELDTYQRRLEVLVEERTAELVRANEALHAARTAEHEQRILAEALRDLALKMIGALDLPELLDSILTGVGNIVSCDSAALILLELGGTARTVGSRGYRGRSAQPPRQEPFRWQDYPLLRQMMETRQPVVVPDIQPFAGDLHFIPAAWQHGYAVIPFQLQGEIIGFVSLTSSRPGFFTPLMVERLQLLAHQVALAVQSVRLHQQAQALAAVKERERLARDLHDAVSQTLFAASVIAESLQRRWQTNARLNEGRLKQLVQMTRGALAEMRTLLLELRPNALLEAGLDTLLPQLALSIQSRKQLEVDVQVESTFPPPPDVKICLYRIAQEALNNIAKHADAARALVRLQRRGDSIELEVGDDGRGFDPQRVSGSSLGLRIMQERAEAAGVLLTITSAPGDGTHIRAVWPQNSDDASEDQAAQEAHRPREL